MKKLLTTILAMLMVLSMLTACGQTPAETKPAEVAEQPAAETDVPPAEEVAEHEHTWIEATCTEPKTCSECGETEGEPLGHFATEADYWTPSVCEVCGVELGPVLTPDFVTYGLDDERMMQLGETYDYTTVTYDDPDMPTVGKVTVDSYEIIPSAEDYDTGLDTAWNLEAKEGYEWRVVKMSVVFGDEAAQAKGMNWNTCCEDYYDIVSHDNSMVPIEDADAAKEAVRTYTVTYNGEEYECAYYGITALLGWDLTTRTNTLVYCVAVQVPIGYDGFVVGLMNSATAKWDEGVYIYDLADADTLFFRMA